MKSEEWRMVQTDTRLVVRAVNGYIQVSGLLGPQVLTPAGVTGWA